MMSERGTTVGVTARAPEGGSVAAIALSNTAIIGKVSKRIGISTQSKGGVSCR
jgi:hypothetical protein